MGNELFYVLDYKNLKMVGPINAPQVCTTLKVLFPSYTDSFAVLKNQQDVVTCDFIQRSPNDNWTYEPSAKSI